MTGAGSTDDTSVRMVASVRSSWSILGASSVPRIAEISDGLFAVTWLTDNSSPRELQGQIIDSVDRCAGWASII